MTLTGDLGSQTSLARWFLEEHLPFRHQIADRWARELRRWSQPRVTLAGGKRAGVGEAIEWRIGLDLAEEVPYLDTLAWLPIDLATRLSAACGFESLDQPGTPEFAGRRRRQDWAPTADAGAILGDVWHLSQYAKLVRSWPTPPTDDQRQLYERWTQVVAGLDYGDDILAALTQLWQVYVEDGRPQMLALGTPRAVRPVFDEAFAVGDVVLGGTLIDIKTYLDPTPSLTDFVDQVLAYALFDLDDAFKIHSVGIYLSWHGALLTVPLAEALDAAAAGTADLPGLRQGFRAAVAPALEISKAFKRGS